MSDIVLSGLDGSNPLAWMAALGVLEVLSDRGAPARLRWQNVGTWVPVVTDCEGNLDDLLRWIDEDRASCVSDPAIALTYEGKQDLKPAPPVFRDYLQNLVADSAPAHRRSVDWAASFGSEVVVDNNGNTKPTALHFAAGQQQFLKMVNDLVQGVTADDLREALVGPWCYARPLPVMGWDATAARDYALRASNPSNDKKLGVPGVDWLAARALTCLPVAPSGARLKTTGCVGGWKTGSFRWPIWTVPLGPSMVRTIVRMDVPALETTARLALGVGAVFSAGIKRSDQGGYGSFTPSTPI